MPFKTAFEQLTRDRTGTGSQLNNHFALIQLGHFGGHGFTKNRAAGGCSSHKPSALDDFLEEESQTGKFVFGLIGDE